MSTTVIHTLLGTIHTISRHAVSWFLLTIKDMYVHRYLYERRHGAKKKK